MKDSAIDWYAMETLVTEAMEDAAIQGLCREGQIEVTIGRLRPIIPSPLSATEFTAVVEELSRT